MIHDGQDTLSVHNPSHLGILAHNPINRITISPQTGEQLVYSNLVLIVKV